MSRKIHAVALTGLDKDKDKDVLQAARNYNELHAEDGMKILALKPGEVPKLVDGRVAMISGHTGAVRSRAQSPTKKDFFEGQKKLIDGETTRLASCKGAVKKAQGENNAELIARQLGRSVLATTDTVTAENGRYTPDNGKWVEVQPKKPAHDEL